MALFDRVRRLRGFLAPSEATVRDVIDDPNKIPTSNAGGFSFGGTQLLYNALTGFGTQRDAAWMNRWLPQRQLTREELFALGRNALSYRGLSLLGGTATSEGWTVAITDDAITNKQALSEAITEYETRLAIPTKCARAIARGRQYGDAIVLLGTEDGTGDWSKPVDVYNIRTIKWAVVLDRRDFNYYRLASTESPNYGDVELYQITDMNGVLEDGLRYGDHSISYAGTELSDLLRSGNGQFLVHSSRVLSFRTHDGYSVLDSLQDSLAAYIEAVGGVRTAAREASLVKYKITDWIKKAWNENAPAAYAHMSMVDRAKSINNAYVIDMKHEDVETLSRNLSGIEKLPDPFMAWLATALNVPITVFWGVSPGGFGKGEAERETWEGIVYSFQTTSLEPQLTKLHGYILAAWDGPHLHTKIKRRIDFADLSPPDEMQEAELRSKAIDDFAKLKREEILTRDEIRKSLPHDAYFSPQLIEIDKTDADAGLGPMQVGAITGSVAILSAVYPMGIPTSAARALQAQVDPQRFTPEVLAEMFPETPTAAPTPPGTAPTTTAGAAEPALTSPSASEPAAPAPVDGESEDEEDTGEALAYSSDPIPTDAMEAADLAELFGLSRRSAGRITKAAREGKFRAFRMFGGRPRFSRSEVEAAWRKDNGLDGIADVRDRSEDTLFVSLRLPDDIAAQFPYKPSEQSPPHVTLAIIEHCPPEKLDAAMTSLLDAFALLDPFDVTLGALDYFEQPSKQRRVAYVDANFSIDALTFHAEIVEALESAGLEVEVHSAYVPHATLAYVDELTAFTGDVPTGTWRVVSIEVQYGGETIGIALDGYLADEPEVTEVRDDAVVAAVADATSADQFWIWRTQQDKRVRSRHRKLNGKRFRQGDKHPTEGEPGDLPNCRCAKEVAIPRDASLKVKRAAKRNVRRALARKYKQITVPAIANERAQDDAHATGTGTDDTADGFFERGSDPAIYTKPDMRNRLRSKILREGRGGDPGEWSARKAQLLALEYKRSGGGYRDSYEDYEVEDYEAAVAYVDALDKGEQQRSLEKWTREEWMTCLPSGPSNAPAGSKRRYLPKRACEQLSKREREAANRKKAEGARKGEQFVANTEAAKEARGRVTDDDHDDFDALYYHCDDHACEDEERWFADVRDDAKQERIDEAFAAYHEAVNMGAAELERWASSEWSKKASLSREPIDRNLRLLRKKKEDWTLADAKAAMRTVSFISRMRGAEQGKPVKIDGREGPSKRDISLKNWAFDPNK